MDTKDVRVENIVEVMYYDDDNNEIWVPAKILAIDGTGGDLMEYKFWFDTEANKELYLDTRPMELTEEILLKYGFEKDDNGVEMYDQDYHEWYTKEFPVIGYLAQSEDKKYLYDDDRDELRIYYLHELQNLYYALTGQELTVKL